MIHNFANKKIKKLYPDWKFISHFIKKHIRSQIENVFSYKRTLLNVYEISATNILPNYEFEV